MKKKPLFQLITILLAAGPLCLSTALGQITLTGASYTQNFDGISNGLPPGWSVRTNASDTSLGAIADFSTNAVSWGTTAGGFRNCAGIIGNAGEIYDGSESTTVQSGTTNRCLAVRQTSDASSFPGSDPGAAFVLQIANTLGVSNLTFSVDLNMLKVNANSSVWSVDYAVGNAPSTFTLLGTNDDPGVFGATNRTFTLGSDADNQPESVWIRVAALAPSALTGTRDTFGIDNFALNYDGPAIASGLLSIQPDGGDVVLTWDDSSYALQAAPEAGGAFTNIPGANSPFTNAMDEPAQFFRLTPD